MATEHIVEQGDCFSSIAKEYGFLERTLWNHPANAALKQKRKNPNVLLPGDVVVIPDRESGAENAATEQKHIFKARGEKVKLQLRLLLNNKPRTNLSYTIIVDGNMIEGKTDSDGWINTPIPAVARTAKLVISSAAISEEYDLGLGFLDPAEEISGVKGRLGNLGFYGGDLDDSPNANLGSALNGFQKENGLEETGIADEATKSKLVEIHGS